MTSFGYSHLLISVSNVSYLNTLRNHLAIHLAIQLTNHSMHAYNHDSYSPAASYI